MFGGQGTILVLYYAVLKNPGHIVSVPWESPVFLPGESQGWWGLVGCHLWGRTESDTTEAT